MLENCEPVVEAAAALATAILKGVPRVRILATSREPRRVEGEHVYRLSPLASPPASAQLAAAAALGFQRFSCLSSVLRRHWANSS